MAKRDYDVCIYVNDCGRYGDIASAVRMGSHLQQQGIQIGLKPLYETGDKLDILNPDVPIIRRSKAKLSIDVMGLGGDPEGDYTPHLYVQDMDTQIDDLPTVPLVLRNGLIPVKSRLPKALKVESPMFHRPFREWDLPKPGERDIRSLILDTITSSNPAFNKNRLEDILQNLDRIGFGYFYHTKDLFNSGYMLSLEEAAHQGSKIGLGLLLSPCLEHVVSKEAGKKGYTTISREGKVSKGKKQRPTLMFLGYQPPIRFSSLFLSSTMPNLVTGTISLSDAIYSLLAMDGQGFYYDAPRWKEKSIDEMSRIFGASSENLKEQFRSGSSQGYGVQNRYAFSQATQSLADPEAGKRFRQQMRDAFIGEINERFNGYKFTTDSSSGLYVPNGAPFLIQDSTEKIVREMIENPRVYERIEKERLRMQLKMYGA